MAPDRNLRVQKRVQKVVGKKRAKAEQAAEQTGLEVCAEAPPDSVILACEKDGSKLRVRCEAFVDDSGSVRKNAFSFLHNVQFSKRLREEGRRFVVPSSCLRSRYAFGENGVSLFYSLSGEKGKLQLYCPGAKETRVYGDASEKCCICLEKRCEAVFLPCGHLATCKLCGSASLSACPLCRKPVVQVV